MQFVNANIAKEAGRLHLWRERLWSRRYRSILVADDKAAHARMRYLLAHAAKEGLLASPGAWPGPNCVAALTTGALLRGKWFDRSKEFVARQRGEHTLPMQFATTFDVKLTPLSCLLNLTEDERQARYRRVLDEIQTKAEADNKEKGRTPMTVEATLIPDLYKYPELRLLDRAGIHAIPMVAVALLCLFLGGIHGLLWGFGVSSIMLWHGSFAINSLAHLVGRQRYTTSDESRNSWILAILTTGEGWHNNHHHFPSSARQGFFWWEFDLTYCVLRGLELLGLVWDLRPVPERLLAGPLIMNQLASSHA